MKALKETDDVRALLALAVMLAIGAEGCGKRGDPLPPLQRIPIAVNPPRVSQQGQEIVVAWETPSGTVDGGALELIEAEVLRRVVEPPPEPLPDAPTSLPSEEGGENAPSGEAAPAVPPIEGEPPPDEVESETPAAETQAEEMTGDVSEPTPTEQAEPVAPRVTIAAPRQASFASEAKVIARIECNEPAIRLEYRDTWDPTWEGMRVEYAVRHVNSKGRRSENSNRRSIEPMPPVPAPSGLEAAAADGFVRLSWSSEPEPETLPRPLEPDVEPDTEPAINPESTPEPEEVEVDFGFNVYRRRKAAESYPAVALNRQLLETTAFEDRTVVFRREWCYAVRRVAVRRQPEPIELAPAPDEDPLPENPRGRRGRAEGRRQEPQAPEPPALIESTGSDEVCLTPIDTFAPEVPRGVVAIGVPGGILLSWSESNARDLEGYRVYRAERSGGPFEPLTPDLIHVPSFTDQELTSGTSYFYTVSAVDGAEPPNESPRSEVVDAQAPE